MDVVAVDDNVLSEVLIGVETMVMGWGWLVNGPVVERWVDDWVLCMSLNQIITVNAINDDISELQVLVTGVSVIVRWRWLVDGPVVEWWVHNWVLSLKLDHLCLMLMKVELIWTNNNLVQTKSCTCHSIFSHNRLWINQLGHLKLERAW